MKRLLSALCLVVPLAGCDVLIGTLRVAAVDPPPPAPALVSRGRRVGEDCHFWLLGVPFGLPRMERAMAAAMAPVHGVVMRDVRVWSAHPFYGPLAGRHCYRVDGEVLSAPETSGTPETSSPEWDRFRE